MEIGAKELYDAIQELARKLDRKWEEMGEKLSSHMNTLGPELVKLEWRVTELEKARAKEAETRRWSIGMKVTVTSLVVSVVLSIVLGALNLTLGV